MENLNYHHLFYFWTVCKEGGFTKAGLKLSLSQSAMSEQVRRLEEAFDQKLIHRTTRRLELTEAGLAALGYADTIFGTGRELLDFMKHRPTVSRQRIRIGAIGGLSRNLQANFLAPLLHREDVQFSVIAGDSQRLLRLLREHTLDIVLSSFAPGENVKLELFTHLLSESPMCLVSSAKSKQGKKESLEEILSARRIFLPTTTSEGRSGFDHFVETKGIKLKVSGEIDDVALLRILALTGLGNALVPRVGVQRDIINGDLKLIHEFKGIKQRFYAITRQKKFPNPIVNDLIRSLR
ncbi:MAG: LysR family transcriptional regulator [Bdellovibrionales bacterium]|nr:LysR family transcriptional regulator [Bdellovibrionales bacterium]